MELKTEKSDLLEILSYNKKKMDKIILDFLPKIHDCREISSLYKMMRDYPSRGGKGIRGTLCLLFCDLFGGKKDDALITASALELFQNWILIHDDIEDQSELRRGLPVLHKKVGIELAINTGDALHGKMWELLLSNQRRLSPSLVLKILSEFSQMLNETTEGQQMELTWTCGNKWDIREKDYLLMVTKKAAWYTCISPFRLGALLASSRQKYGTDVGLTPKSNVFEKMVNFGTNLGIAFQIVDDVLNLTADESKYGKEICGDLLEGKRTLMLINLLDKSTPKQHGKIVEILSKPRHTKTKNEVRFVLETMKESGAIDYAKRIAQGYSKRALKEFEEIAAAQGVRCSDAYHTTKSLLEYLTLRDY